MRNFDENYTEPQHSRLRVSDMADSEKPREKAMAQGLKSLTYTELIAIALGSGLPGKSVVELSHEILNYCDNKPARMASLTINELCNEFKGIGPAKAISLLAAIELGMRVHSERAFDGLPVIRSGADVEALMGNKLKFLDHEEFWVLLLDRRNRVRITHRLSSGGTSATVVDLKQLFKMVVLNTLSSIIVIHNHPSGNLRPSADDDNLTRRIKEGGKLLDVRLLDHIIISEEGYYSYTEEGKL